ncbi:MAG: hypothetical protein ETSY1_19360 [Candidatus Entotheonella factor]|uniref:Glycosyltransferase subfamily 4-like N-terminal domain-containing protein n=1 Tax=Entotheonella factor TaxID=1429438 RepID=W4LLS7_ENTF1|nr:glycosyltransferase family 4 protein [Candidatus Entotheonella palauensis]ETW98281.1 MAG: hypothetical protein ETSY1_19360 [Candidatus Entotheonella factor]
MHTSLTQRSTTATSALSGKRILVLMPSIPIHGMERANLRIMQLLRERGAHLLCVTEATHGQTLQREVEQIGGECAAAPFAKRLHVTKHPWDMLRVVHAWTQTSQQVRAIYQRYHPTHIYVTNLHYFLYAWPMLRQVRCPVILRLPNPPDRALTGLKQGVAHWIWRHAVGRICDIIVCNSKHTAGRVEALGITPAKLRIIYNVAPDPHQPQASDAPPVDPDHWNIVYLGRIHAAKGVQELFHAALRLVGERPDIDFYFAGEHHWQNPFASGLIRDVIERGLQTRLHFLGHIQDVFGLLKQCNLHVLPSLTESFPNAVLEAKRMGLPSVIFPSGGMPEAITHCTDGYICRHKTTAALYDGIRYFIDDPARLNAAGEAARSSLTRFSRTTIAQAWVNVFQDSSQSN